MGQSVSSTARTGGRISHPNDNVTTKSPAPSLSLKTDIFDLETPELVALLNHHPLTGNEIQQYARAESPERSKEKAKAEASGLHFYSTQSVAASKAEPTTSREMTLAIKLCKIPQVSQLRFQLVPSRLKEDVFWQAAFSCLKERLIAYNTQQQHDLPDDVDAFSSVLLEQEKVRNIDEVDHEKEMVHGTTSVVDRSKQRYEQELRRLQKQVQSQNAELLALRKQIKELKQQQHHHHRHTNTNGIANGTITSHHPSHPHHHQHEQQNQQYMNSQQQWHSKTNHRGKWKMDADSQEFLQFPADVKESLRKEKQKRLAQVQQEMKFILDGDELHHTHGRWDCCGQTSYHAAPCCGN